MKSFSSIWGGVRGGGEVAGRVQHAILRPQKFQKLDEVENNRKTVEKIRKMGQDRAEMAKDGFKMTQEGPRRGQDGSRWAKMGPRLCRMKRTLCSVISCVLRVTFYVIATFHVFTFYRVTFYFTSYVLPYQSCKTLVQELRGQSDVPPNLIRYGYV